MLSSSRHSPSPQPHSSAMFVILVLMLFCMLPSTWAEEYSEQITVFSDGRLTRFDETPIRIYVLKPPQEQIDYVADFDDALSQWHEADPDVLSFVQVDDPEGAHIQVRWASLSLNQMMDHALGDAKLVRSNVTKHHVEITASLRDKRTGKRLTHDEMRTVCLHELGHALGLWGHSPDPKDIMYYAADVQTLSSRDRETIRRVYASKPDSPLHASAVTVLKGWIEQTPEAPRFHYLLGSVLQDAGEYDAAADAFIRCLELDLSYRAASERLVEVYKQLGRTQDAMMEIENLLQAEPTPQIYNSAGGFYYQQGDLNKAREYFQKALELDQRYRPARHNLFALLRDLASDALEKQQYGEVIELTQEALHLEPTDAHLWLLIGNAHASLLEYEIAIDAYREALKQAPSDKVPQENIGRTYNNWGVSLVNQKQFRQGIEKYRQALGFCPDMDDVQQNTEDAYWKMAAHLVEAGKTQEGIAAYRELLAANPKLTEIHAIIGGLQYKQADYAHALDSFQAALKASPDMPEAKHNVLITHIQYGQVLDQQQRYAEAIEHFQEALALKPDHLDTHILLAQAYRHANRMDDALNALEKASELDPSNTQIQKSIANVYIQRGNQLMRASKYKAAAEAFEAIPTSQKNIDICNTVAYLRLSSGELMLALPALQAGMALDPRNEIMFQNLQSLESQLSRKFDPRPGKEKPGTRDNLALAQTEVARCLLSRGEYTPAKNKYQSAYDLKPTNAQVREALINVGTQLASKLKQIGWPKNARTVAEWLHELDPANATAKEILGP